MTTRQIARRAGAGWMVARLGTWYLAFGLLKHLLSLQRLARWSWQEPQGQRDADRERQTIGRTIWIRRLIGQTDRDCLQRSLVLYRELSRAGADPALMVGFANAGGRVRGHAWVVANGLPVAESSAEVDQFVSTLSFGRGGVART